MDWITIFLFALSWGSILHIYESRSWIGILFIILGFIINYLYFEKEDKRLERSIYSSLSLFIAQLMVIPFYFVIFSRYHSEKIFLKPVAWLLNIFGVEAVANGSKLYIDSSLKTITILSNWEKVGILFLLLLFISGLLNLYFKKAKFREYIKLFSYTFLYGIIRYFILILLYREYNLNSIFWERTITFISFLPYPFILNLFMTKDKPIFNFENGKFIYKILAFLLIFSQISLFSFYDKGKEKSGRVLVDEYHSDWEWTTDKYDREWFGERSGYNYYSMYNHLDKFYNVDRNMSEINEETLKDIDVFIMKTPTLEFKENEINIMVDFVENGGGLYLIGDHTNVFGTGTNLNQLSKNFNINFNYDSTYELTHGTLSEYEKSFLSHPAINNMPKFLFATSNTLKTGFNAEEIIIGYGLKNLFADYSQKNFFPADTDSPESEFGLFLQAAGMQYGKGRVLAFTDSTVFSNFWMFMPGKPELLLGSVDWLNKTNTLPFSPRYIIFPIFIILLVINILFNKSLKDFVKGSMLALLIGTGFFYFYNHTKLPQPIKPIVEIAFDEEYSDYKIPKDLDGFMSNMEKQLNTFYVWTQRLDYIPSTEKKLVNALDKDVTIIAKPNKNIKNIDKIFDKINNGGKLLILDNFENGALSNEILKEIDMEIVKDNIYAETNFHDIKEIPLTDNKSIVKGGESLISDINGKSICSYKKIGEGYIIVFSDPDLFYSYELGDVSANLNEKTDKLSKLVFELLSYIVEEL